VMSAAGCHLLPVPIAHCRMRIDQPGAELAVHGLTELPETITAASDVRRKALCRLLVRRVTGIKWVSQARPLLSGQRTTGAPKGIRTPDLHLERVAS
jgi:hypothetical protein